MKRTRVFLKTKPSVSSCEGGKSFGGYVGGAYATCESVSYIGKRIFAYFLAFTLVLSIFTPVSAAPVLNLLDIDYTFDFDTKGRAGGTVTITSDCDMTVGLYWGNQDEVLENYTVLVPNIEVRANELLLYPIQEFTAIPPEATQLLACNGQGDIVGAYAIPPGKALNYSETTFKFGAVSDPHFGKRYDSKGDIPKAAFRNASGILAAKGVSLIAISGDVTLTGGRADEFADYKASLAEFYQQNANIPVYTVTETMTQRLRTAQHLLWKT